MQRPAKPWTPVRFRPQPPNPALALLKRRPGRVRGLFFGLGGGARPHMKILLALILLIPLICRAGAQINCETLAG